MYDSEDYVESFADYVYVIQYPIIADYVYVIQYSIIYI